MEFLFIILIALVALAVFVKIIIMISVALLIPLFGYLASLLTGRPYVSAKQKRMEALERELKLAGIYEDLMADEASAGAGKAGRPISDVVREYRNRVYGHDAEKAPMRHEQEDAAMQDDTKGNDAVDAADADMAQDQAAEEAVVVTSFTLPENFSWAEWRSWRSLMGHIFSRKGMRELAESSLEAIIGGQFFIWLGGISLAIGALFFVMSFLSFDFWTDLYKTIASIGVSAGVIAAAYIFRKKFPRLADYGAALGLIGLLGSVNYAHVSDLISSHQAFLATALISAAGYVMALMDGMGKKIAGIAILGAYFAPIYAAHIAEPMVILYVLTVSAALMLRSVQLVNVYMAAMAGLGGLVWFGILSMDWGQETLFWLSTLYMGLGAGLLVTAHGLVRRNADREDESDLALWPAWVITGLMAVSGCFYAVNFNMALDSLVAVVSLAVAVFAFVYKHPRMERAIYIWTAVLAGLIGYACFKEAYWGGVGYNSLITMTSPAFILYILVIPAMFAGGVFSIISRRRTAFAVPVAFLGPIAYLGAYMHDFYRFKPLFAIDWLLIGLILTLFYLLACYIERKLSLLFALPGDDGETESRSIKTMYFISACASFSMTALFAGNAAWIGIFLTALVPVTAYLSEDRNFSVRFSVLLALIGLATITLSDPRDILDASASFALSWVTPAYLLPALLTFAGVFIYCRRSDALEAPLRFLTIIASLSLAAWIYLEPLQWHKNTPLAIGAVATGYALASFCAVIARRELKHRAFHIVEAIMLAGAVIILGLEACLIYDAGNLTLFARDISEGIIFNEWILMLALPGAVLMGLGCEITSEAGRFKSVFLKLVGYTALMSFLLVSAHHAYYGGQASGRGVFVEIWGVSFSSGELFDMTVTLLWGLFGLLLIWIAIAMRDRSLRIFSLVTMCIVSGKLFLYDMSALEGMARALSFLGIGGSLSLIGWVYRNYVVVQPETEMEEKDEPEPDLSLATDEGMA